MKTETIMLGIIDVDKMKKEIETPIKAAKANMIYRHNPAKGKYLNKTMRIRLIQIDNANTPNIIPMNYPKIVCRQNG